MIYSIYRTDCTDWDEYDEIIVRAPNEKAAKALVLSREWCGITEPYSGFKADGSNMEIRQVPRIGPAEVICASFNAG